MYDLPYHKDSDPAVIHEFIASHPFAFLTGCDADGRPVATQVPVFIEEREGRPFLSGHIMKDTDHRRAFEHNPNVLAVFSSPHSYVSARWYTDPSVASTWNYMSVHARGVIRLLDRAALEAVLQKTSLHFEGGDAGSATVFENLPDEFRERVIPHIVAFEIEVLELEHVFKLSQDRDAESQRRIIEELGQGDAGARFIAGEMKKRLTRG